MWSHGSQDRKVSEKEGMFYPFKSCKEIKKNENKEIPIGTGKMNIGSGLVQSSSMRVVATGARLE